MNSWRAGEQSEVFMRELLLEKKKHESSSLLLSFTNVVKLITSDWNCKFGWMWLLCCHLQSKCNRFADKYNRARCLVFHFIPSIPLPSHAFHVAVICLQHHSGATVCKYLMCVWPVWWWSVFSLLATDQEKLTDGLSDVLQILRLRLRLRMWIVDQLLS